MTRQLWAPWRLAYIEQAAEQEGCVFCVEAAGALAADASLVVHRDALMTVLLNKFPYVSGHLMIAPARHVAELGELTTAEAAALHVATTHAVATLRAVFAPQAFNVGSNLGAVAGGSIAAHFHQHVVPRWAGDTNFMPVLADVKVIPEHLQSTRARLAAAWPG
jgi:ATP adenylyltransferase